MGSIHSLYTNTTKGVVITLYTQWSDNLLTDCLRTVPTKWSELIKRVGWKQFPIFPYKVRKIEFTVFTRPQSMITTMPPSPLYSVWLVVECENSLILYYSWSVTRDRTKTKHTYTHHVLYRGA